MRNIDVTQNQGNFIPFAFNNFTNYDCLLFFKRFVDKKSDRVKFVIILRTKEEYIFVTYGCKKFNDRYRFLACSLGSFDKTPVDINHEAFRSLKKEVVGDGNINKIVNKIE